jgi:chemotaxis protein histidine kinase CheA
VRAGILPIQKLALGSDGSLKDKAMINKGLYFSLLLIVSLFFQSCDTKPPAPPAPPKEEKPIEQPPAEQPPAEEASLEESPAEESPAEQAALEGVSPQDAIKKIQLDYLKFLHSSMETAMAENDLEKTDKIRKEMIKAYNELKALENSEQTSPEPETSSEQPQEESSPSSESDSSEEAPRVIPEATPAPEEPTEEKAEETPKPASAEESETKKESASEDLNRPKPMKYKIFMEVIPKTSSKKVDYNTIEELGLRIKLANQNLNNPTGPLTLYYFIMGKGTRNSSEYKLLDSGEINIELGDTAKDRFYEYTSEPCINKYWNGSSPGYFKYDFWYVAVADSEGNMVASKTNKSQFNDFNKFMHMKKGMLYDKTLSPLPYKSRY